MLKCLSSYMYIFLLIPFIAFGAQTDQEKIDPITKLIMKGNAYAHKGNYEKALAELNQAVESDGKNARAYKVRGHIYIVMGELQKALEDLSKVLELAPDNASAWVDRAIIHYKLNNRTQANKDINHALELAPRSVFALGVKEKINGK